jgi:hypothetical protein
MTKQSKVCRAGHAALLALIIVPAGAGCSAKRNPKGSSSTTPENHPAFPIGAGSAHAVGRNLGDSVLGCTSCHPTGSYPQFSCVDCHTHAPAVTDRLHLQQPQYAYASTSCYACHAKGAQVAFDHAGIHDDCAMCHDANRPFAALPGAGHMPTDGFDCGACHGRSRATGWTSWAGARLHTTDSTLPVTCLPCHRSEAPTSTAGWRSTSYALSPFDYGTNSLGIPHGGALDCAICHAAANPGASGSPVSWLGGHYAHGTPSLADETCIACHVSQRPDLQPGTTAATAAAQIGFDHAPHAGMDCIGCHSATVAAETYVSYLNPATSTLPGGDWRGGQSFPGSQPVGFPGERIELETHTLDYSAAGDFVTGTTKTWQSCYDVMIHTSPIVPPELRPSPAGVPDYGTCWHCHYHRNGKVVRYPMGKFHYALDIYTATPDGPPTPLPQPTQGCRDCHEATRPTGIVGPTSLQPMNHEVGFESPTTVAGAPVTGVKDMDCSTCHHNPGGGFSDGRFHGNTATAVLPDCVSCHYVTMADGDSADVTSGTAYRMKHTSLQLTFQTCTTCHATALANAATIAAESWKPGRYHGVLATQPTACNDCHTVSLPPTDALSSPVFDHGALGRGTDRRDCGDCHTFPGTGTPTAPNWLGATVPPG